MSGLSQVLLYGLFLSRTISSVRSSTACEDLQPLGLFHFKISRDVTVVHIVAEIASLKYGRLMVEKAGSMRHR